MSEGNPKEERTRQFKPPKLKEANGKKRLILTLLALLLLPTLLLLLRSILVVLVLIVTPILLLARRQVQLLLRELLDLSLHEPGASPLDLLVESEREVFRDRVDVVSLLDWSEVGGGVEEDVETEEEVEGLAREGGRKKDQKRSFDGKDRDGEHSQSDEQYRQRSTGFRPRTPQACRGR